MNRISPEALTPIPKPTLDVADRNLEVVQILLQFRMLLRHLLVLALPLVTRSLERLHLAFVMTSLDVGLAEPVMKRKKTAVLVNAS